MRKSAIAGLALWAAFAAFAGKAQAEVNYPWCIVGDNRGIDCVFSGREQCMQDGRNRGFGGQCIQNPYYKPGKPTVSGPHPACKPGAPTTVSQTLHPSQPGTFAVCAKKADDLGLCPGHPGRANYINICMGRGPLQTGGVQQALNATTCTGMKLACPFSSCYLGSTTIRGPDCEKLCNSYWEECMKTGWWMHAGRQLERR
jgi:hypothetical protein